MRDDVAAAPAVSVVIPTFNCAPFVAEAVESVRAQTWADLEVVVVDDGSTDDTARVLEPYRQSGAIRYLRQDNRGPSAARNAGIRAARGRYVAFLDADDTIPPSSIERRLRFLDAHPDVAVVFTDCYIRDRAGETPP
ncbi:MAG TPA: glycosyltransferase family A protein, partial [Methylomirabilota bacterium]|nr:glycosyltransferase family A protein [Methylomirabilota bacterium]